MFSESQSEKEEEPQKEAWMEGNSLNLWAYHQIRWPSLTVDWLPNRKKLPFTDFATQNLILGLHSGFDEFNYLLVAQACYPIGNQPGNAYTQDVEFLILKQIKYKGAVNCARHMPQNHKLIATKATSKLYIFNYALHPSRAGLYSPFRPELKLMGHTAEASGRGLSWNRAKDGYLLSGSNDGMICIWNINATPINKSLSPLNIYKSPEAIFRDVAWNSTENIFGSVGIDHDQHHRLHVWDSRVQTSLPQQSVVAHQDNVNSLSFHPVDEWILATGSSDESIKLFDLRKISTALHTMVHLEEVLQVGWNPRNKSILASRNKQGVHIWDTKRIGQEQRPEDPIDGPPPELLFIHGGHRRSVLDFSWNQEEDEDWHIASVADETRIQFWRKAG